MTSFDYLQSSRPLRGLLHCCRLPARVRPSANALVCSCIIVAASWAIEANRLHQGLRIEDSYAEHYDAQVHVLAKAHVYEKRVQGIVDLDRRVRYIVASGTSAARRLAAIAADLPQNVWLTSVAPDSTGTSVEGRTSSFSALSMALRRLSRDSILGEPTLTNAQVEDNVVPNLAVRFSMHVADRSLENIHASP